MCVEKVCYSSYHSCWERELRTLRGHLISFQSTCLVQTSCPVSRQLKIWVEYQKMWLHGLSEFHHFMGSATRAALELHFPSKPLLVDENSVQHSTFPHWFLWHLEKEFITNTLQEPLWLLMPCCVVHPKILGWLKTPMRTRTCEGCCYL